ncbi:flagellar hook-associated protein FlgK [Novipirellula artificiosorum]|uniref:Flagellar hook-associated protein 1 n=1 Tax=Novipirellula artificiosorum TaxID=2528016 RepID=A0A5C6DYS8_9BACT|nr:flagellar hook-associated protein FlgK [Novipirellula artificiosorum]TWU41800.1 Flagellar hook-associated protein 1 [Novipirellula artificiosorum]
MRWGFGMGLLGTIQQAKGGLDVAQIGLQVVGNNVANANTPGYIRQQLQQASSVAVRDGNLIKGHGVLPTGIVQVIDQALAERMMNAKTALTGAEALEKAYNQLEELSSDLDNTGLSQQFSQFNNSIHELSAQPGDTSLREFVILQGETLASNLRRTRENAVAQQITWDGDFKEMANQINRLTERIAELNLEISTIEGGGGLRNSDATGLRDQRYRDLEELSTYVQINYQEQASGAVNVFVGGDYLVSNSNQRDVFSDYSESAGGQEIRIIETDSPLQVTGGKIAASKQARDGVFGDYIQKLDKIAAALIRSVNEVHSQGQGREAYQSLTSSFQGEGGVPLASSGMTFIPDNGTFDMNLVDDAGEILSTHQIAVRRLGQVSDSSINSVVAEIDAIAGISASVTSEGYVEIISDSPTSGFTFGEDTSGFLAAIGINTFFVGKNAVDIDVNAQLKRNSDLLAISSGGIGEDTDALTRLVDLVDRPLDELDGRSVRGVYEGTLASLGQKVSLQSSETEGLRNFHSTLESQHLSITGVNIDEESIKMIAYQRAFQASSKVIATAAEMLDILVNL